MTRSILRAIVRVCGVMHPFMSISAQAYQRMVSTCLKISMCTDDSHWHALAGLQRLHLSRDLAHELCYWGQDSVLCA